MFLGLATLGSLFFFAAFSASAYANAADQTIASRTADIDASGQVMQLDAETSLMWKPIVPLA